MRFRWTGQRATFFVPGHTNVVDLPVRAVQIESLAPFVVEFRINGRRADDVRLEHDMWQRVRLTMPPQDHRNFHRIDLFVSPSWRPAELLPGSSDPRRLGVMFGEITVDGPGKSQRLLDDRPKGGVRSGLERFYAAATN